MSESGTGRAPGRTGSRRCGPSSRSGSRARCLPPPPPPAGQPPPSRPRGGAGGAGETGKGVDGAECELQREAEEERPGQRGVLARVGLRGGACVRGRCRLIFWDG